MKTFIVTLFTAFVITSCSEDEEIKPALDPFVGAWSMQNTEANLKASFLIEEDLTFSNINIEYQGITEPLTYHAETFGRFAVNAGYEEIKIFGGGDTQWIIITMLHNRVHLATPDTLDVYTMKIEMVNKEPVELKDQMFFKNL